MRRFSGLQATQQQQSGCPFVYTDGIEVNVGHRSEQRPLIEQCLALEAAFPEMPDAVVLGVGLKQSVLWLFCCLEKTCPS